MDTQQAMKRNRKILISERTKTILLFLSVVIMMMMFIFQVWNNLFAKDNETKRIEREREERRIQREEWLKNMK
ncbi:hypothetical protein [Bacillus tropicus]|uniref:hypothetical protein n=2 Tax=Bacillus TaxID=1386 RepID=UPI00111FCE47|nr:hypothetical protein [Bacillus tropicus]MED2995302.1 hypothetical protein [Bacillus tropicus]